MTHPPPIPPASTSSPAIALVPSPLVAPATWEPVRSRLVDAGWHVVITALDDDGAGPFWRRHAVSAARALDAADRDVVLIAHSGAGPLLPLIDDATSATVVAAVFVDAGLPVDGTTRLEQLAVDAPDVAVDLSERLHAGGVFPQWSSEDLADLVRDEAARNELVAGLRPRGLDFFREPLAVPPPWQRVPCGYVRLSAAYDVWLRMARDRSWPVAELDGGHFQLIDDPAAVVAAVEAVLTQLLEQGARRDTLDVEALRFDERGLIPAIVQHHHTGEVLMFAWMNADTLRETLRTGETVFWSRSRGERWHKGATSGNTQRVVELVADCDADVVLVRVDQRGEGACHTGSWSCFERPVAP